MRGSHREVAKDVDTAFGSSEVNLVISSLVITMPARSMTLERKLLPIQDDMNEEHLKKRER
jgi:hypothetical protein